jgi:hypothetical protein
MHSRIRDQHAFLSPSRYHWLNYSDEKLDRAFLASQAAKRGTELHSFAHQAIRLGVRLPDTSGSLNSYVNDGIGYRMTPEQPLYYSDNAFGHADCISFRRNVLRVHDLKTGTVPASYHQLEIYVGLFCLEYKMNPVDFETELRIYQNNEVRVHHPDADVIFHVMDRIITFDKRIESIKEEARS